MVVHQRKIMSLESCTEEGGIKGKRQGLGEKIRTVRLKYVNLVHMYES
jgi:hypothetical protein